MTSTREALGLLTRCWGGPLPDEIHAQLETYADEIDAASGATASAAGTVGSWKRRADELASSLSAAEVWRDSTHEMLDRLGAEASPALTDDLATAISRVSELSSDWACACAAFGEELSSATTTLTTCSNARMGTVAQRQAVSGPSYFTAMAVWAHTQAMSLSVIDPTGRFQRVADGRLDEFLDGDYAALQYMVVETMNDGNILEFDGNTSFSDWAQSTDYTIVRYRLEMAAKLAGYDLDAATLDALALDIVATAVFTTVGAGDRSEDVDSQIEPDALVTQALGDKAVEAYVQAGTFSSEPTAYPTEIDYYLPANATDADRYVEAWLAAKLAPDTSPAWFVTTTVWSFFVPDVTVMNPFSDDFSPLWTAIEIVGIGNPLDEGAGVLRAASNIVDGARDAMRASDEFAEVDYVLDFEVLSGAVDEVAAGTDEVLQSGDELLGAGDEAPGGSDSPELYDDQLDAFVAEPPVFDLADPLEHMSDDLVNLTEAHLTGSGESVIGPFRPDGGGPTYVDVADQRGASYFDLGDAWNDYAPREQLAANQHFLDVAIDNGDTVRLSVSRDVIVPGSYTAAEVDYLLRNGYTWLDGSTLAPMGG